MARIVLIDDEARLLQTLARFLEREGHTVTQGTSFAAVQDKLWPGRFEILITDIVMPDVTGMRVLQTVVGERKCQEPVILITGEPNLETAAEAVRSGAFDYVSKPVTKDSLLEVVTRGLRQVQLLRERDAARENELQLLRNLARLGESASVISHELRAPVTGLRHALRAVGAKIGVEDRVLVEELVRGLDKIEKVLGQTLSFVRPMQLDLRAADLGRTVQQAAADARKLPAMAGMDLQVEVDPGLPPVRIDEQRMGEVLVNLLRNAGEACGGNGHVTLSASAADGVVAIEVVDDGPGIAADRREEVFRPFHSSKEYGTGIGLAFCRKVVESHGGRIGLVDRPGYGACFRIELSRNGSSPVRTSTHDHD